MIDASGVATDVGEADNVDDVDASGNSTRMGDNKTSGYVAVVGASLDEGSNEVRSSRQNLAMRRSVSPGPPHMKAILKVGHCVVSCRTVKPH